MPSGVSGRDFAGNDILDDDICLDDPRLGFELLAQ
jgi:hypothetical protein